MPLKKESFDAFDLQTVLSPVHQNQDRRTAALVDVYRGRKSGQVKRSQMGNFDPGGPSSAVSGNTPTVQATTPMTAPTVPPASTTVTKVGQAQVMFAAWADEFEKIIRG